MVTTNNPCPNRTAPIAVLKGANKSCAVLCVIPEVFAKMLVVQAKLCTDATRKAGKLERSFKKQRVF